MRYKALPILIFIALKRSGEIKFRRVVNSSYEHLYADKTKCTSPTLDFTH